MLKKAASRNIRQESFPILLAPNVGVDVQRRVAGWHMRNNSAVYEYRGH